MRRKNNSLTILIGPAIVVFGVALIFKGQIILKELWSPNVSPTGSWKTYFLCGVTLALGSISCTVGPFLAVSSISLGGTYLESLLSYIFYGLGFTVTIACLAIATALFRDLSIKRIRSAEGVLEKILGGLMAIVGDYQFNVICKQQFKFPLFYSLL